MSATYKKDRYDYWRKEVCDEKDNHKPKHCSTYTLCLLEQILEEIVKLQNCKCTKPCEETTSTGDTTQSGVVNIDVDSIVKAAKKK